MAAYTARMRTISAALNSPSTCFDTAVYASAGCMRAIKVNGGVVQCVALASFLKSNEARSAALRKLQEEIGLKGPASEGLSEEERDQLGKKVEVVVL